MLFDLRSGKRKRVVQVVYGLLAFLFFVGFVGFSIGSDVGGGLFDAIGITNDDGGEGDVSSQFDDQIEAAQQRLETDPDDERALLQLAQYQSLAGRPSEVDENTGQPLVSADQQTELGAAVDAWERYLDVVKGEPDADVATQMVQTYVYLNDYSGAASAQAIVAERRPSEGAFNQLAFYHYAAGEIEEGDAAAEAAVSEAAESQRADLREQFEQMRKQAIKLKEAQEKAPEAPPGENPLENPFGGVSPGG